MSKCWRVTFYENGDEYEGCLRITANSLTAIDSYTILADDVQIQIDELIVKIEEEGEG